MPQQPTVTIELTTTEIATLLSALDAAADQELDDPRNYTAEDLRDIALSQRAMRHLARTIRRLSHTTRLAAKSSL